MLVDFEKKVADFAASIGLFNSADKILLAISGGADSTALLYVTNVLVREGAVRAELICAHINHQLRGSNAWQDQEFVIAQAHKLKLPVITKSIDVRGFASRNKLSVETAARQLRIKALMDIAKANHCGCVATAHQRDDNAETIIHRLARGTGLRGLAGIWPARKFGENVTFLRPLLCVTKKEITNYLKTKNLKWRLDRTNKDCRFTRNYIRHRLIGQLQKQCEASIAELLFDLSVGAQRLYRSVCNCADGIQPALVRDNGDGIKLKIDGLSNQHIDTAAFQNNSASGREENHRQKNRAAEWFYG